MSLNGIFHPLVRNYFEDKYSGGGGGESDPNQRKMFMWDISGVSADDSIKATDQHFTQEELLGGYVGIASDEGITCFPIKSENCSLLEGIEGTVRLNNQMLSNGVDFVLISFSSSAAELIGEAAGTYIAVENKSDFTHVVLIPANATESVLMTADGYTLTDKNGTILIPKE